MNSIKHKKISMKLNLTYYSLYPIYFNRRYKTKFLQIKCKIFFFLLALLETTMVENSNKTLFLLKYNIYKTTRNKFTFPRAPYKNKLAQIVIGQQFYILKLYIILTSSNQVIPSKIILNTMFAKKILMLNSPMLTLQNIHIQSSFFFNLNEL